MTNIARHQYTSDSKVVYVTEDGCPTGSLAVGLAQLLASGLRARDIHHRADVFCYLALPRIETTEMYGRFNAGLIDLVAVGQACGMLEERYASFPL